MNNLEMVFQEKRVKKYKELEEEKKKYQRIMCYHKSDRYYLPIPVNSEETELFKIKESIEQIQEIVKAGAEKRIKEIEKEQGAL